MSDQIIKQLHDSTEFRGDLVGAVLRTNDIDVFVAAVSRSDCPPELLVDLFQARSVQVRRLIAAHKNTPQTVLQRLASDPDALTARRAVESLANV